MRVRGMRRKEGRTARTARPRALALWAADVGLAGRPAVEQTRRRSGPLKRRPVGQTKGRRLAVLMVAWVAERFGGAAAGSLRLRDAGPPETRIKRASDVGKPLRDKAGRPSGDPVSLVARRWRGQFDKRAGPPPVSSDGRPL
jgi:hypothetical protein